MSYTPVALEFRSRQLPDGSTLGVSTTGDYAILTKSEIAALQQSPVSLPIQRLAELRSRFFIGSAGASLGTQRLIKSRIAAKRETVRNGPSLHIIVPTLQCAHSCKYCQVSRSLDDVGHTMTLDDLDLACDAIFQSPAKTLTVEFQGGDPLLRFDLVRHAIVRIKMRNETEGRRIRFVVASTLHQLDETMCEFFQSHQVFLSTSVDGPKDLHNSNRPTPTRNAYERTVAGIDMARRFLGAESVSALMTTTKASLKQPEDIVDEYVALGFRDIFLRPLSSYGFAMRNQSLLGYGLDDFTSFYQRGLARVLHWNRQGVELREVYATIILNKMLSTFDGGYVDLQSPTGAGQSVLVYNYDGFVYPSDEARMLAETGDRSLRLGRIGTPLKTLQSSAVQRALVEASLVESTPDCKACTYRLYCAPNPIDAQAQFGTPLAPVLQTEHCRRHLWLFDSFFMQLQAADPWTLDLFHRWAAPTGMRNV